MADRVKTKAILANFDCEDTWANSNSCVPSPPKRLKKRLKIFSDHLTVFSDDKTTIVMPWEAPDLNAFDSVLAWGETERACLLRSNNAKSQTPKTWQEALWQSRPTPDVAKAINHKRFSFNVACKLDCQSLGQSFVASTHELQAHMTTFKNLSRRSWLIKAPYSAAGRHAVITQSAILTDTEKQQVSRLFERFETIMIMPWHSRVLDYSVAGVIGHKNTWMFPPHFPQVDSRGVVRAIEINDEKSDEMFSSLERKIIQQRAQAVLVELSKQNYRGPFSIDGFVYELNGDRKIHAISEINGRLTFGLVARAHSLKRNEHNYILTL